MRHAASTTPRMKFANRNAFIKKARDRRSVILNMSKMLGKEEQVKPKESPWEEIIKIMPEMNEIEDRK